MKTLILMICLTPGLAFAERLYRCVNQDGDVSYQAASCPAGQRTDRIIEFVPQSISAPTRIQAGRAASRPRSGSRQTRTRSRQARPDQCALAKTRREDQLQRLGLRRTFDDLSRIDAAVRAVCRGY